MENCGVRFLAKVRHYRMRLVDESVADCGLALQKSKSLSHISFVVCGGEHLEFWHRGYNLRLHSR